MNKLKLVSALIISLSIGIIYAKDIQNINDQAEEIIYLYAEIIDSKNFSELKSIMQTNFKMTGMYEIDSLEEIRDITEKYLSNFNNIEKVNLKTSFLKPKYGDASGVRGAANLSDRVYY